MTSEPRRRIRAISAKQLSSQGYSVCLFPEQPTREIIIEEDEVKEEPLVKSDIKKVEAPPEPIEKNELVRLYWRNRLVYLLAFIAFSLSLNNVYHFPMNIMRYGENFFFPYTIATVVIGYPLHMLQTSIGQYAQLGCLWVWECAPVFFGVGFSMVVACVIISLYYNLFAAYSLVYFAHCFSSHLPGSYCTDIAWDDNDTCMHQSWYLSGKFVLPSKDYFYNVVLNTPHRSPPEEWSLDSFKWWLFLSLLFSWIVVYVATLRSARSIGKMAIIIVIFSYFTILTLLILAFQVKKLGKLKVQPDQHISIFSAEMWCAAIIQVLLELGICFGIPIVYGSYCRFRNVIHIDSIILCLVNYLNSIIFFYLFFSFLRSFSCNVANLPFDLPDYTIGIIYIIYSEAFSTLSGGHYWCAIFFLMLFLIIIGTQIAIAETIMCAIYDNFIQLIKFRWLLNLLICIACLAIGVFFCFSNGYFGTLAMHYIPTLFIVVPLSCLFLIGIVFVYGFDKYSQNMETMREYKFNVLVRLFLYVLIVIFILIFILTVASVNDTIFTGKIFHHGTYLIVTWVMVAIILCPVLCCCVIWASRTLVREKVLISTKTWIRFEELKKKAIGQFTWNYSPSYKWEWNRYE